MTTLAAQLAAQAAAPELRNQALEYRRLRSLLYHASEAATIDLAAHLERACVALNTLVRLDPSLEVLREDVLHESSVTVELSLLTAKERDAWMVTCRSAALRMSAHLQTPGALHIMEWLVQRFEVARYSPDVLFLAVLPYHNTTLLSRFAQLLEMNEADKAWHWLKPVASEGVPLHPLSLQRRCSKDPTLFSFILEGAYRAAIELTGSSVDSQPLQDEEDDGEVQVDNTSRLARPWLALATATASGVICELRLGPVAPLEAALQPLVQFAGKLLRTRFPDVKSSALFMVQLCVSLVDRLEARLCAALLQKLLRYAQRALPAESVRCALLLVNIQNFEITPELKERLDELKKSYLPELAQTTLDVLDDTSAMDIVINDEESTVNGVANKSRDPINLLKDVLSLKMHRRKELEDDEGDGCDVNLAKENVVQLRKDFTRLQLGIKLNDFLKKLSHLDNFLKKAGRREVLSKDITDPLEDLLVSISDIYVAGSHRVDLVKICSHALFERLLKSGAMLASSAQAHFWLLITGLPLHNAVDKHLHRGDYFAVRCLAALNSLKKASGDTLPPALKVPLICLLRHPEHLVRLKAVEVLERMSNTDPMLKKLVIVKDYLQDRDCLFQTGISENALTLVFQTDSHDLLSLLCANMDPAASFGAASQFCLGVLARLVSARGLRQIDSQRWWPLLSCLWLNARHCVANEFLARLTPPLWKLLREEGVKKDAKEDKFVQLIVSLLQRSHANTTILEALLKAQFKAEEVCCVLNHLIPMLPVDKLADKSSSALAGRLVKKRRSAVAALAALNNMDVADASVARVGVVQWSAINTLLTLIRHGLDKRLLANDGEESLRLLEQLSSALHVCVSQLEKKDSAVAAAVNSMESLDAEEEQEIGGGETDTVLLQLLVCLTRVAGLLTDSANCRSSCEVLLAHVLRCLAVSSDHAVHNESLLLVVALTRGSVARVSVHHLTQLFTFVSRYLVSRDDTHSLQVLADVLQHLVPALIHSENDRQFAGLSLAATFAACRPAVPPHRRVPLFAQLSRSLGVEEHLWLLLVLLQSHHMSGDEDAENPIDPLCSALMLEFDVALVLKTCTRLLLFARYLSRIAGFSSDGEPLKKRRRTESQSGSGADEPAVLEVLLSHQDVTCFDMLFATLQSASATESLARRLLMVVEAHLRCKAFRTAAVQLTFDTQTPPEAADDGAEVGQHDQPENGIVVGSVGLMTQLLVWLQSGQRDNVRLAYDCLLHVELVVPVAWYLKILVLLLTQLSVDHSRSRAARHAAELLQGALHSLQSCDTARPQLRAALRWLTLICGQSTADIDQAHWELLRTALHCGVELVRLLALKSISRVLKMAQRVAKNLLNSSWTRSWACVLLAECFKRLGEEAAPLLPLAMSSTLETVVQLLHLNSNKEEVEARRSLHLTESCVEFVKSVLLLSHNVVDQLFFIAQPYLVDMLAIAVRLTHTPLPPDQAELRSAAKTLLKDIALRQSTEDLLPALRVVFGQRPAETRVEVMRVLSRHIPSLRDKNSSIAALWQQHGKALVKLCVGALSLREEQQELSTVQLHKTECRVIMALKHIILHLDSHGVLGLLQRLQKWCMEAEQLHRMLPYLRLLHQILLADVLPSDLSVSTLTDVLDLANLLSMALATRTAKDATSLDQLLTAALGCFSAICKRGALAVSQDLAEHGAQQVAALLDFTEGEYIARNRDFLLPCFEAFGSCAEADTNLLEPLVEAVATRAQKSTSAITRLWAVRSLDAIRRAVGPLFVQTLLRPVLHRVAECLEDDEESVEAEARKFVRICEKELGEPLQL